jgi:chaperone modulatory protein CbpM
MNDSTAVLAQTITITELAYCSGCSAETILELLEHDLLQAVESTPEPRFQVEAVGRVRRIRRIEVELEVGYPAMALVLDLLDRIEALERRLKELQ